MGVKISSLPITSLPYTGNEQFAIVQSGSTKAGTLSSLTSYLSGALLSDSELAALSGNWQSTSTTFRANSANYAVKNANNNFSASQTINGDGVTLNVGNNNNVIGSNSVVLGGTSNLVGGPYSAVVGGVLNQAAATYSSVVGGSGNYARGNSSTIIGGTTNIISSLISTYNSAIIGGNNNYTEGRASVILGGAYNTATGANSVVAGAGNTASGVNSLATGTGSIAHAPNMHATSCGFFNAAGDCQSIDVPLMGELVLDIFSSPLSAKYAGVLKTNLAGQSFAPRENSIITGKVQVAVIANKKQLYSFEFPFATHSVGGTPQTITYPTITTYNPIEGYQPFPYFIPIANTVTFQYYQFPPTPPVLQFTISVALTGQNSAGLKANEAGITTGKLRCVARLTGVEYLSGSGTGSGSY